MNSFGKALELKKSLVYMARDPLLMDRAIAATARIFEAALTGNLRLAPAASLDPEAVRAIIAASLDPTAQRVVFISAAAPLGEQPWASSDVSKQLDLTRLTRPIQRSVNGWANYDLNFVEPILNRTENSRVFATQVWNGLVEGLATPLHELCGPDLGRALTLGYWYWLVHFFAYVIKNMREETIAQAQLLKLVPSALPLGRRTDDTGTWVVLTA